MVIATELYKKIQSAPSSSGVYIFKDKTGEVLYIGKAIHLKKRLTSYTKDELQLDSKTAKFLSLAQKLEWIEVKSDLEAVLLEMNLIRTLKPKYNIVSKDDKRPLYVLFTNDDLPRVKTARVEIAGAGDYIGPFPSAMKLRRIMKSLRRIFPYCSCSALRTRPCMFADLGLCYPSPPQITTQAERKLYKRNISRLKQFLRGHINQVVKTLEKDMKLYSQNQEFEKAQETKNRIDAINHLLSFEANINEYLVDTSVVSKMKQKQLESLALHLHLAGAQRIEGYDVANTGGLNPTASMVVFENGYPNTSEYRKFHIRGTEGPNDPLMLYQALKRRFFNDWPLPQLILVDGGRTQVKAALKALSEHHLNIPVIGLAKRYEQLVIPRGNSVQVISPPLDTPYLVLLRAIRDEAHRFATTYHKVLRSRSMLGDKK